MTVTSRRLASGPGWRVDDLICRAGRDDRPFEEQHRDFCVAAVTSGTFRYRATDGTALLAPGALLLGNQGACFECGHEHAAGDRCLSFHFSGELIEEAAGDAPGVHRARFAVPRLPPLDATSGLFAEAEAAREDGNLAELEEIALRLAAAAVSLSSDVPTPARPNRFDERRVSEAVRLIESDPSRSIELGALAAGTATSRFHFLRVFRQVTGLTPYQYVLRLRLHGAAVRLRRSSDAVSAIAYEAGFNDLSTFNRRFRRVLGLTPQAFRAGRPALRRKAAETADSAA